MLPESKLARSTAASATGVKPAGICIRVAHKSDISTAAQRRMAVALYLEGLGFRSIGRILGFSHVAIYQWIKALGEEVAQLKRSAAQIVEMDEMHSYVGQKKLLLDLDCC